MITGVFSRIAPRYARRAGQSAIRRRRSEQARAVTQIASRGRAGISSCSCPTVVPSSSAAILARISPTATPSNARSRPAAGIFFTSVLKHPYYPARAVEIVVRKDDGTQIVLWNG